MSHFNIFLFLQTIIIAYIIIYLFLNWFFIGFLKNKSFLLILPFILNVYI